MNVRQIEWIPVAWVLSLVSLPGCASHQTRSPVATTAPLPAEIRNMFDRQADAWNNGDVEQFMQPYWRSPHLTFSSGGKVTRGWKATLDGYKRRYPTLGDMGTLTFSDLEAIELDERSAIILGRWKLVRDNPVGGAFTLVLRKDHLGKWIIIHDHTSRDTP